MGDDRNQHLAELLERNQERVNAISAQGFRLDFDELKFRHLMSVLFPTEELKLEHEISWQEFLATNLDAIEADVRRQQLQQPGTGLVLPPTA